MQALDEVGWSTGFMSLPSIFHPDSSVSCFYLCDRGQTDKICHLWGETRQNSIIDHNLTKAV